MYCTTVNDWDLGEDYHLLKATVENTRGCVEILSPKESVKGTHTVLRGSVRAPKGFSDGKPEAAKPREPSHRPASQCGHPRHSNEGTVIPLCPNDFQQLLILPNS